MVNEKKHSTVLSCVKFVKSAKESWLWQPHSELVRVLFMGRGLQMIRIHSFDYPCSDFKFAFFTQPDITVLQQQQFEKQYN